MYKVIKELEFSYGHRLTKHAGKCHRVHGHNARVLVEVQSETLDEQNMVVDFDHLKQTLGNWIDETLDHRLILWKGDPLTPVMQESGEDFLIVDEHPTAEFLAAWIYTQAKEFKLPVSRVEVWETPGSCAVYE